MKIIRKLQVLTLTSSLVLGAVLPSSASAGLVDLTGVAANTGFKDTNGHWAKSSIDQAVSKGYVDGYEDGTFKPDVNVTRAEFLKMLSSATDKVDQIDGGVWYGKYVAGLKTNKILRSDEFNDYDKQISRLEMAKVALRSVRPDLRELTYNDYSDKEYVFDSVALGLIQGLSKGDLALDGVTTRSQAVTIIERVLVAAKNGRLEVDKRAFQKAEVDLRHTNMFAMFGYKTIGLPFTVPVTSTMRATINNIIVIDGDDQDSPYNYLLEDLQVAGGEETKAGNYIFAYDTDFELSEDYVTTSPDEHFKMTDAYYATSKYGLYAISKKFASTTKNNVMLFLVKKERINSLVKDNNLNAYIKVNNKDLVFTVKK